MEQTATAPESSATVEFDVHKAVIADLIHSQNGTLATAIRELIMNSIDAGAEKISISLNEFSFTVVDDGRGFESREDIEDNFRVFGQPHVDNDAIYGRFRIGRGQIMSFAEVSWASKRWKMDVDVEKRGYAFELSEFGSDIERGCRVSGTLYRAISAKEVQSVSRSIRELVAYCNVDVLLNEKMIAPTTGSEKWDIDNERFQLRWSKTGDFRIYNQGVFVKELSRYSATIGGVVVTKKPLQLNMARNEVTERDPLWREISQLVDEKSYETSIKATYSRNVAPEVRANLIDNFINCSLPENTNLARIPILLDVRGHSLCLNQIARSGLPLTICENRKAGLGDMIATSRRAIVLSEETPNEWAEYTWNVPPKTAEQLLNLVREPLAYQGNEWLMRKLDAIQCITFEEASRGLSLFQNELPAKSYSKREKIAVAALQSGSRTMARLLSDANHQDVRPRKIGLGLNDTAQAWTDGHSRIWYDKRELAKLDGPGNKGGITLAAIMLHEYLHEPGDCDDCSHSFEFYKLYHDLSADKLDTIGRTANAIEKAYVQKLSRAGIAVPKGILGYHARLANPKGEKYTPWNEELIEYDLFLKKGEDKLSRLDGLVLKKIGNLSPRKKKFRSISRERVRYRLTAARCAELDPLYEHALRLNKELENSDYFLAELEEGLSSDDRKEVARIGSIELEKAYFQRFGTDRAWWNKVFRAIRIRNLLQLLVDTENSNIEVVEYSKDYVTHLMTPIINSRHSIRDEGFSSVGRVDVDSGGDESAALAGAVEIIAYAFSTLRKKGHRDQLAKSLLSEAGRERIERSVDAMLLGKE